MIIIDVRDKDEAVLNIPLAVLQNKISAVANSDDRIVLLCESGFRSRAGYAVLHELGYTNVCALSFEALECQCVEDNRY